MPAARDISHLPIEEQDKILRRRAKVRERKRETNRKWREANPEKVKAVKRRYQENNAERIRERAREKLKCPLAAAKNRERVAKWRSDNLERARENSKQWLRNNPDSRREYARNYNKRARKDPEKRAKIYACTQRWRDVNGEHIKNWRKDWQKRNPNYKREKYYNSIQYRISECLRARLWSAIHNKSKTGSAVRDLGCTIPKLMEHLEKQFKHGMTWKNYGLKGWHIDHIKPLAIFDLTDREQFLEACHYTNLQPLWWHENLAKGAKYEPAA